MNAENQPALKALPSPTGYCRDFGYICLGLGVGVILSVAYAILVFGVYLAWAEFLSVGMEILGIYLVGKHRSRIYL